MPEDTALQTGAHHKQLRLRHGTFQPEQKSVVEGARVIETLLIQNQRVGQRTRFQQMMPIDFCCAPATRLPALRPVPPVRAPPMPRGAGSRGDRQWRQLNDPGLDQSPGYVPRPSLMPERVHARHTGEKYLCIFKHAV